MNHCVNVLRTTKRSNKTERVIENFIGRGKALDFNKIIEMPKDLENSLYPLAKACENKRISAKKLAKLDEDIRATNLENYGYETPEDWARDNWGPEYNCYNYHAHKKNNAVIFDTANWPPIPIISELAKKTKCELKLYYAEPGASLYGEVKIKPNGECLFKDYTEENIPDSFHKEFPTDYPPTNNSNHKRKSSYPELDGLNL